MQRHLVHPVARVNAGTTSSRESGIIKCHVTAFPTHRDHTCETRPHQLQGSCHGSSAPAPLPGSHPLKKTPSTFRTRHALSGEGAGLTPAIDRGIASPTAILAQPLRQLRALFFAFCPTYAPVRESTQGIRGRTRCRPSFNRFPCASGGKHGSR